MKFKAVLFLFTFITSSLFAQKGVVTGVVKDAVSSETLIGVSISYQDGKGDITNENGVYKFTLDYGTYTFKISYVGYETQSIEVVVNKAKTVLNFDLSNQTLKEVEIVADVAKTRETPVAFSTIKPATLNEELANQDIPMVLNRTPGVYATQQGGGDGDSRINIRGFSQRNIAVMIDGVPVNDMENGWVYWSNWFGLDMVTRSIQVQRGLGASKLALPSVGGTMNIITKGIENKKGLTLKQDIGSDGYYRTSFGLTSGKLKNDWSFSLAGSYKTGDGWVDMTWTEGYFFYFRVDKSIGNHNLSLQAYGAPQSHGQRSFNNAMHTFSEDYAIDQGVDSANFIDEKPHDMGLRYNQNWGYLNRWELDNNGDTLWGSQEKINEKMNYYFKPQISLRDVWSVADNLYISTIAYLSIGSGGGTGITSSSSLPYMADGTKNFQQIYDNNMKTNGTNLAGTGDILHSAINNHTWFGILSNADWKISNSWKLSGGIDLRDYKGEHYREAYDMLGAEFYLDRGNNNAGLNNHTRPDLERYEGDILGYHNDGLVRWGGLFSQLEFKQGNWTAFLNLTAAYTGYKRIDYFKKYDLVFDDTIINQAVGYTRKFDPNQMAFASFMDTLYHNGQAYTMNSPEARVAQSDWHWIPGYTIKLGANYNLSETMNVFFNTGYLNKAPRFNNVFDYNNFLYRDIRNELIKAFELGYSFYNTKFTINLNAYTGGGSILIDDVLYRVNINGMDALHKGVELEMGYRINPYLLSETVVSVGDWRWTSADSAQLINPNTGVVEDMIFFDARGLKVGDAAQLQLRESLRWQITKAIYVRSSITFFGNHFANFDPFTLDPVKNPKSFDDEGNPRQSWEIPNYYLVDFSAGYSFNYKKTKINIRLNVLNLLDEAYISDARNNDQYTGQSWNDFDARSAGVFFGMGRRFMTSIQIKF